MRRHWRIVGEWRAPEERLPPPLTGRVGGLDCELFVWPGDAVPGHPEAFKPTSGCLAGYWVLVRFP